MLLELLKRRRKREKTRGEEGRRDRVIFRQVRGEIR